MKEKYLKIEQYLSGALADKDLRDFEASLVTDRALAAEVVLHRQLQETFVDPQEVDLRLTLQQIRQEAATPDAPQPGGSGAGNWGWWVGGVLLLAVAGWLLQPLLAPASAPAEETPAAYLPNPDLEALLDTVGNAVYDFELTARPELLDNLRRLKVEGSLYAVELPADSTFLLQVYSNQPADFPNNPSFTGPVRPQEMQDTIIAFGGKKRYAILFDEKVPLPAGLHYYTVREKAGTPVLMAGKVTVE